MYVRGRGVLPPELSRIESTVQSPSGEPFQFPPTELALDCHYAAKGMPRNLRSDEEEDDDSEFGPSFLWGSVYNVATLGGLFFSNTPNISELSSTGKNIPDGVMILDGNSCERNYQMIGNDITDIDQKQRKKNIESAYDELLKISLSACHAENLLFKKITTVDALEFTSIITTQLNILKLIVDGLFASKIITNVNVAKTHPQYERYREALSVSGNKEIDAVVLLTWISTVIHANKERVHLVWSKMHGKIL